MYWCYSSGMAKINRVGTAYCPTSLKPAVECILVTMKPLTCDTYTEQYNNNGKGVLWLNDCSIPYTCDINDTALKSINSDAELYYNANGRMPANILSCDNVLDDGNITFGDGTVKIQKAGDGALGQKYGFNTHKNRPVIKASVNDSGSFNRYFDLDAWFRARLPEEAQKTYPYLIVPKPCTSASIPK